MKKYLRVFLFAFLIWIIPYISSLIFLPLQNSDKIYFKTIMMIVGNITGVSVMYFYFQEKTDKFLAHGVVLGVLSFCLGIILDMVGVLPFSDISFVTYMKEIGFRYLAIPIMSITIGLILEKRVMSVKNEQDKKTS